MLSKQLVSCIT